LYLLDVIYGIRDAVGVDVFEVVAEPSRRALLDLLAGGERSAGELVATLPHLTQPAVSRHLRVLREVGLVEVRPDAQRRIYALRPDGLAEIDEWLGRYRRYWAAHLDALERHLARTHGGTDPHQREHIHE
jgi:DNA-binding transcriptional ArsR family regulator